MKENELHRAALTLQNFYADRKWFQFVGIGENNVIIVYYSGKVPQSAKIAEIYGYSVIYEKIGKPKPLSSTE